MHELTETRQAVEERLDASTQFLRELVRVPSVLGAEEGAQVLLERRMRDIGFAVRSVEPDAERLAGIPESGVAPLPYAGRRCLIGNLPGHGDAVLALNGHIDVVPTAPDDLWTKPPFGGVDEHGRIYGRGAADMKGGVAAMLLAVEAARSFGPLPSTVVYHSVIEEECTGNGAITALLEGPLPDAALIAEPTGGSLHLAGTGVIFARITVTGESGHVMEAGSLVNPVEEAYRVIEALRALEQENNERPPDPAFADVHRPYVLNIGALNGGAWPASSPANAVIQVRMGFPDSLTPFEAQRLLADAVAKASSRAQVDFFGHRAHGYAFDPETDFVRLLRSCHEEVHGSAAPVEAVRLTTDLRLFRKPFPVASAACYGPTGGGVHGLDEWVDVPSIADVATVLALLLRRWSGDR